MLNNAKVDGYKLKLTNRVMKKYLFIALALLGMASCAKDDLGNGNKPHHNGEVEESYIAINLMAADVDSRAAADAFGYEDGTPAERVINSAYFFFFDENGNPFNILGAPGTAPGGGKNHMQLTIGNYTGNEDPNVSDIREAILVLSTYKGIYPSQVVAVLNWTPSDRAYTLKELQEEVVENSLGNDTNGYVMSNSVYSNGTKIMAATPIAEGNIKTTADDAKAAPVEIYVERTAAKVVVTNTEVANNKYPVTEENGFKPIGEEARTVYVELLGWELYNEFNLTNLVKSIDNWESIGLTWNDSPFFRSYWAETMNVRTTNDTFAWSYADPSTKGLPTQYGYEIASVEADYTDRDTYTYCGENTLDWTTNDVRTKVILKGRLVEEDGTTLELARWYGNEYAGVADLKNAVAGSLAYTVFYLNPAYDSTNPESPMYISIAPEHIEIVHGDDVGAEAYEVGFQLTTAAQSLTWYQYSSAEGHKAFGDLSTSNIDATNAHLADIQPAVLYTGGDTYYIVDIKHLGAPDTITTYGIVRNHVYQLDIQSIKGYGSPGYSGFEHVVDNPEYPEDDETSNYVAAKINVLSWKVVKQSVNIEQ